MTEQIERVRQEIRFVGPSPLSSVDLAVQVTPDGNKFFSEPTSQPQGWYYSRNSSTGQPIEAITVIAKEISYETSDYRRWENCRQRIEKVAGGVFDLAVASLDVEDFSLEYYDRFNFRGPENRALPSELLVGIDTNLHPDAQSGRTIWHLHRGWYEIVEGGQVLINQNFDATDRTLEGTPKTLQRSVAILTKAEMRAERFKIESKPLLTQLDSLHKMTKYYFQAAIQPSVLKTVGISTGE